MKTCDCIERLEKMLTEKMVEEYPNCEVIESVEFQNTSFLFGENCWIFSNPVLGKVQQGKRVRRFETSMMPNYCPFCGIKHKEE